MMHAVLISTYELGRQPFGLASPAAWLRREGARVTCNDLAVEALKEDAVRAAGLVAFYVPMHTATRIAARVVGRVKAVNPEAHLCFYGLYASLNEPFLRRLGADTILGGEFETGLVDLARRLSAAPATTGPEAPAAPTIHLDKQRFIVPDRSGLPPLSTYGRLKLADGRVRTVGYTEASRGCRHLCRHCPVVPVYDGTFRIVQRDVVLHDIRQQVEAGAQHITFGDPDFFNGVGHALELVRSLHREHPDLTYDVTVKVEHLLRHAEHLVTLRDTGCLLVTTAVESIDDRVLAILDKGHTRGDFLRAIELCGEAGLTLNPTFVAFTPWISIAGYQALLSFLAGHDLIGQVAPVQLAIRLLIPAGSKLLELPEVRKMVKPFDEVGLVHPWRHSDPEVDRLQSEIEALVQAGMAQGKERREVFQSIWQAAGQSPAGDGCLSYSPAPRPARSSIPYLTEPWYC